MTYTDERLSARWKERRARFLGCIENTKLIAERTKQRQESARIERLKKERAEMEKYRQRLSSFFRSFFVVCLYSNHLPSVEKKVTKSFGMTFFTRFFRFSSIFLSSQRSRSQLMRN